MADELDRGPVVLAEDDAEILARLRDALRAEDLVVVGCRSARAAFDAVDFHRPSVLAVDVAMEEGRGWELLFAMSRRAGMTTLVIDRLGDPLVRRGAIAAGAGDVVAAPFEAEEVAARVRMLVQRQRPDARGGPIHRHGDLVVDVAAHEARVAGRPVALTPQQFAILRALCEARGATLHRSQLLARIAAIDDEPPSDRAVDLHVSRLRRRLGDDTMRPRYVEAVYGIGYRLAPLEREVSSLAEHAAAVLEALPDAVLVLDEQLRVRAANRSALRMLDRPLEQVVGTPCEELLRCRTCEGAALAGPRCLGRAVLAGESGIRHVPAIVRADGDAPVRVVFSHAAIRVDGAPPLVAVELHPAD